MRAGTHPQVTVTSAAIPAGAIRLDGDLSVPAKALGIVLFAHGSGSSRRSPRNRYVAELLQKSGMATLLFDLLTPDEEQEDLFTGQFRFDIGLLSRRLVSATEWVAAQPDTAPLGIGYFGASTGAAAALTAAGQMPGRVKAIVSRGGRPDLAGDSLSVVRSPTLLIVGGDDEVVIGMSREAAARLTAPHALEIVPGATHLFEEPGALDEVARLAAGWFRKYLAT